MKSIEFKISKWTIISNYIMIPVCFIIAAFFILGSLFLFQGSIFSIIFFFILGFSFIAGAIYAIKTLPQLKDIIHISETQIMRENSSDGSFISINWDEDFTLRNRQFLGRLDLISQDGERIVKIEHQTKDFQVICDFINMKLMEKQQNYFD